MAVTRRSLMRGLVGIILSGLAVATLGAVSAAGQEFKTERAAVRVVNPRTREEGLEEGLIVDTVFANGAWARV
jgi:hypothetical protein